MRRYLSLKPVLMGVPMGLMVLAMVHMILTGQRDLGAMALIGFVALHVVFGLVIAALGVFAARFAPALKRRHDRLHRPSLRHVGFMLSSAGGTAYLIHILVHGGL